MYPLECPRLKKTKRVKLVGEVYKGQGMNEKQIHIELFKDKSQNAADMIANLFR